MKLSPTQLEQYQTEGYVLLGKILSDEQLEQLRADEAEFRRHKGVDEGQPATHFFSQMNRFSPAVREVIMDGPHVEALPQMLGTPDIAFRYDQFVTKMPDRGSEKSEFPWHQDEGYAQIEPAGGVTVWIALDDCDRQNGCIWVVPRSHAQGLMPHQQSGETGFMTLEIEGDGEAAPMKAGEAIAFSGLTLHRSKYNRTEQARRAFFVTYTHAAATMLDPRGEGEATPVLQLPHAWMVSGRAPLT